MARELGLQSHLEKGMGPLPRWGSVNSGLTGELGITASSSLYPFPSASIPPIAVPDPGISSVWAALAGMSRAKCPAVLGLTVQFPAVPVLTVQFQVTQSLQSH